MVMLGAAAEFMPLSVAELSGAIETVFGAKGASVVEKNLMALSAGNEYTKKQRDKK